MGVIKQSLPLFVQLKVTDRLTGEVESQFTEAGLTTTQISAITNKVVAMAKESMGGKFTRK